MRKSNINRKTEETKINLSLNLDGRGKYKIDTSIPFLDHMLTLFTLHSNFDLKITAQGDREVDDHHLVEDIGIVLGQALKKALKDKKRINRYGNFLLPMDEALSYVVVDISGRPYLKYKVKFKSSHIKQETFDFDLIEDFFRAVVYQAGMTLHISIKEKGKSNHHIAESIFKGFGKTLAQAVEINPKIKRIPSTKGKL